MKSIPVNARSNSRKQPAEKSQGPPGLIIHKKELWTARQRQMQPIHYTVSYRASFKPELPDFFIRKYLVEPGKKGSIVLDPFGGRGTTVIQANLHGYSAIHNDLNPVSIFLASARKSIPPLPELIGRLESLDLKKQRFSLTKSETQKLTPFFHPDTLQEILNLRKILLEEKNKDDPELKYIGVTALSRLHGHSDGFFSVYSFPQISILPSAQLKNNRVRGIQPEYRNVKDRILKKMKKDLSVTLPPEFYRASKKNHYTMHDARRLDSIKDGSVNLVVTSPPFLNKVDYLTDNWMRSWFLGFENQDPKLTVTASLSEWSDFMRDSMREIGRVLAPGGRAVIEVGEVDVGGRDENLEESLLKDLPMKVDGGFLRGEELYINLQNFTKLANCWEVKNNLRGTNTNRCLVLLKSRR